jgi:hypothetical protein
MREQNVERIAEDIIDSRREHIADRKDAMWYAAEEDGLTWEQQNDVVDAIARKLNWEK